MIDEIVTDNDGLRSENMERIEIRLNKSPYKWIILYFDGQQKSPSDWLEADTGMIAYNKAEGMAKTYKKPEAEPVEIVWIDKLN